MKKKLIGVSVLILLGAVSLYFITKDHPEKKYGVYYVEGDYFEDNKRLNTMEANAYCNDNGICGFNTGKAFLSVYASPIPKNKLSSLLENEDIEFYPYYDIFADLDIYLNGELFAESKYTPYANMFPIYDSRDTGDLYREFPEESDEQKEYVYISNTLFNSVRGIYKGEEALLTDIANDENVEIKLECVFHIPTSYNIYEESFTASYAGEKVECGPYLKYEEVHEISAERMTFYVKGVLPSINPYATNLSAIFIDPDTLNRLNPNNLEIKRGIVIEKNKGVRQYLEENGFSYYALN